MSSFAAALRSLPPMAVRLVLMRFLFFLGIQCGYFIGIVGTLTYTLSGGVADNPVGIVLLNACLVAGSFVGGPLLDRMGPRRYYAAVVVALVVAAAALVVAGSTRAGVFVGAALLGGAWGMADLVPKAFPAYLSDDAVVLKNLNSVIYTVSNASVVAGPLAGGAIAAAFSTNAVFWLLGACAIASAIPALGFRPLRVPVPAAGDDEGAKGASLREGFSAVFSLPALTLLFWSCFLSFFAYGAFDPIESLYYRDVLQVGVEWMGWLSSVSGVGGILGALQRGGVLPGVRGDAVRGGGLRRPGAARRVVRDDDAASHHPRSDAFAAFRHRPCQRGDGVRQQRGGDRAPALRAGAFARAGGPGHARRGKRRGVRDARRHWHRPPSPDRRVLKESAPATACGGVGLYCVR